MGRDFLRMRRIFESSRTKKIPCAGSHIRMKPDQENPTRNLMMIVMVILTDSTTVFAHSSVGDSGGNDMIENICRIVQCS